jgi:transmembrane sensor
MSQRESSAAIDEAAAAWVARLDGAPLTDAESAELDAWLAADIRCQGAFAKARAVMVLADRVSKLDSTHEGSGREPLGGSGTARMSKPSRRWMLAAGSSIAAGVAAVTFGLSLKSWNASQQYETGRGEMRRVPLADGTVVTLNTATKVLVQFSKNARDIQLLQGEALFDVAKNYKRPFVVDAGDIRVRAVGTSFSVLRLPSRPTQVLVREGIVEITQPNSDKGPQPIRLAANEQALARPLAPIIPEAVAPEAMTRKLSWRQGMLSFEGTSLQEAAEEFSRYSDTQITVDDPIVANETISGLFSANNPAGFAHSVALSLNLNTRTDGNTIHLSR